MKMRYITPLLLASSLLLVGAGCGSFGSSDPSVSLEAVEAGFGLDLPNDTVIDNFVDLSTYYFVKGITQMTAEEFVLDIQDQLRTVGYSGTFEASSVTDEIGSGTTVVYMRQGETAIQSMAVTVENTNSGLEFGILRQGQY